MKDEDLPVAIGAGADADRGDRHLGRDLGRQLARNAFEHDGERAGLGDRQGVVHDLVGRALNFVGAQPADGLGAKADVAHHGNIGVGQGLDGGRHLAAPFELDGLAVRLLENSSGRLERLPRRDLIAEKRQVGDDERSPGRPGHHFGVVDDLVDRDAQGRFPTLNHRAQRVADQDAIDAGGIEQAGWSGSRRPSARRSGGVLTST